MKNKLPFFLALILSGATLLILDTEANAQWQRDDRRNERRERVQIQRDNRRQERTIIIRPGVQVYSRGEIYNRNDRPYRNDVYVRTERFENNDYGSIAQIARLNGYNDGLYEGKKDARDGERYDPFGESDYKDGDDGYKSRYGNKPEYKQIYRQSFLQGYREAFNRYLGYTERNW